MEEKMKKNRQTITQKLGIEKRSYRKEKEILETLTENNENDKEGNEGEPTWSTGIGSTGKQRDTGRFEGRNALQSPAMKQNLCESDREGLIYLTWMAKINASIRPKSFRS